MNFKLVDLTDHKLYLAIDFFDRLNSLPEDIGVFLEDSTAKEYRSFFKLFKNIQFKSDLYEQGKTDRTVRFADSVLSPLNSGEDKNLLYPILEIYPDKNSPGSEAFFEGIKNGQVIPFNPKPRLSGHFMGDPESALDMLFRLDIEQDLSGKKVLLSAGPTAEDIDPVRYLTNRSSGKMGLALAQAAWRRGAEVCLILGPAVLDVPGHIPLIRVRSAADMAEAVFSNFDDCDVYIGSAAIADFTPEHVIKDKIKKQPGGMQLNLKRTTDILKALAGRRKNQSLIGFSLETRDEIKNSMLKLKSKNLDFIVINNPGDKGAAFAVDTNLVTVLTPDGSTEKLPLMSKLEISNHIFDRLLKLWKKNKQVK